ncbi:hypothetical protein [Janibacter alkaliphilus]|uniref:DUF8175 domain-containing protein n=1 Tax=Janibacter alkaliphilus TaxID=1069963 RepID=A0A852X5W4_9MICO|nr:hypothetical protein [Janibacter alkaliphilus]NYG37818.1 hypothetical protein [Janibacter alkaliphilus]
MAAIGAVTVVVLVLACGLGWFLGRGSDDQAPTQTAASEDPAQTASSEASASTTSDVEDEETDGQCGLPVGSQAIPAEGPDATWEIHRSLTVPSSEEFGPAEVTDEGDRRCFAHNPTGALFFFINVQALEPELQARHVLEGGDDLAGQSSTSTPSTMLFRVQGYQLQSQGPDEVQVTVVYRVNQDEFALRTTVVWREGDWMVERRDDGSGRLEVSEIGDYVAWGQS